MSRLWWCLSLASVLVRPVASVAQTVDSITGADMRHRIGLLADDSMRGRATPSRGLEQAARYAGREFRRLGLEPAGDSGSYLQRYAILKTKLVAESSTVRVYGRVPPRTWRLGRDVHWLKVSLAQRADVVGPAVLLVGIPDSTHPFAGTDVRGAVIIHLAHFGEQGLEAPVWLLRAAARAGVAGWILVTNRPQELWQERLTTIREPRTLIPRLESAYPFPIVEMLDDRMGKYLADLGITEAGVRPLPAPAPPARRLPGLEVRLHLVERVLSRRSAPNVLAVLPGADSARRQEYVLLGAHIDALGIGKRLGGDSIYNGADDDASGTAAVLEVAEALARAPERPARSILFALFSGTEQDLWGSQYYVAHPPAPLNRTIAAINVESIGHSKDSLAVIGAARSPLGAAVERVSAQHPELGLTVTGDRWPQMRLYDESDHAILAHHGVPVLFLFNGPSAALHRPFDELRLVDTESAARIARFLELLARDLAAPSPQD